MAMQGMSRNPSTSIPAELMPGIAVGIVLMTLKDGALHVLSLQRDAVLHLPYGRLGIKEPLRRAAERITKEQTGLQVDYLEQLYSFGNVIPSEGERLIEVCYYGLVAFDPDYEASPSHEGSRWLRESDLMLLPELQARIVLRAIARLRGKLAYTAVGFELLPQSFTLAELQQVYETILGKRLDKRNFRRRVLELGILSSTGEERIQARGRPAALYSFSAEVFQRLDSRGDILAF
jgi:8-oxo-dGTP diphosphatase